MAGIFSFSGDVLGIGGIVNAFQNDEQAMHNYGVDSQTTLGLANINAQSEAAKKQRYLIGGIAGGIGFLILMYILLKD